MKKRIHIFPILLAALLLVLSAAFCMQALHTKLLPGSWLAGLFAFVALVDVLLVWLCARPEKKLRFAFGVLLTILYALGLCAGSAVFGKTLDTIENITQVSPEFSRVCVYVRIGDEAQYIADVSGDSFGLLAATDRENTDSAIEQINGELGISIKTQEFDGLTALLDALFDGEIRAILLNPEFLTLAGELPGYEGAEEKVKLLSELRVEQPETEKPETTPTPSPEAEEDNCFSVYISGNDTYGDISVKSRSDVNIIVTVNTKTHQILLLTTPRDYYVPLTISDGKRDKLTHSGIYGIEVSKGTMEMLYDTEIDYYFRVNFSGFQKIIDAIGGVDAELDGYAGVMHLNGEEALKHARNRAYGDQWRGKNQLRIVQAAINKVLSPAILTSFNDLLDATGGSFETTVPYDLIAELVREQLQSNPQWEILRYNVTGTGDSEIPFTVILLDGKPMYLYVMWPDEETVATAIELMSAMQKDEIISIPE